MFFIESVRVPIPLDFMCILKKYTFDSVSCDFLILIFFYSKFNKFGLKPWALALTSIPIYYIYELIRLNQRIDSTRFQYNHPQNKRAFQVLHFLHLLPQERGASKLATFAGILPHTKRLAFRLK